MTLDSVYGQAAAAAFFGNAPRDGLTQIEARIAACNDARERATLCQETIAFRRGPELISLAVDVAGNCQLLEACRAIGEFRFGYEPEIHAAIDLLTPASGVIYDIGSNWGPVSLQAALREGFSGRVFAFEPQFSAFADLTTMVKALALSDRVFPNNVAVSEAAGEAHLTVPRWGGNVALSEAATGASCRLVRLDELSLPDPHLIKIDVEGHERQVMRGAEGLLRRVRPFVIFEDWRENPKDHFGQLAGDGYSFYFLGWHDPFSSEIADKPPFMSDIQIFALQPFDPATRGQLPERINVLASPHPLAPETRGGAAGLTELQLSL